MITGIILLSGDTTRIENACILTVVLPEIRLLRVSIFFATNNAIARGS
jgi:hypothetical protein